MYLIRRGNLRKRAVAHIWHGDYPRSNEGDTACRMASTGGLNFRRYLIAVNPLHISKSAEKTELPICHMCQVNSGK